MTNTGASSGTPSGTDVRSAMRVSRAAWRASAAVMCGRGSSGCAAAKLLQRLACLVRQLLRHRDLDGDEQVAGLPSLACTPRPRTRSVRPDGVPGRRPCSATDAVERRHPQRGAERGLGEGDRHRQGQVVAAAAEQRRAAPTCTVTIEVAGRPAARARACPCRRSASSRRPRTPGRHAHGDRAGLHGHAAAVALRARVVDDLPGAAAVPAGLAEPERALVAADEAGAPAGRAACAATCPGGRRARRRSGRCPGRTAAAAASRRARPRRSRA